MMHLFSFTSQSLKSQQDPRVALYTLYHVSYLWLLIVFLKAHLSLPFPYLGAPRPFCIFHLSTRSHALAFWSHLPFQLNAHFQCLQVFFGTVIFLLYDFSPTFQLQVCISLYRAKLYITCSFQCKPLPLLFWFFHLFSWAEYDLPLSSLQENLWNEPYPLTSISQNHILSYCLQDFLSIFTLLIDTSSMHTHALIHFDLLTPVCFVALPLFF